MSWAFKLWGVSEEAEEGLAAFPSQPVDTPLISPRRPRIEKPDDTDLWMIRRTHQDLHPTHCRVPRSLFSWGSSCFSSGPHFWDPSRPAIVVAPPPPRQAATTASKKFCISLSTSVAGPIDSPSGW
eukprot:GHVU01066350.1.p1 GENE.GHVU01066350.1~~GHVU01066350.1.p1  ORF type:complete len:126 (+),score=11.73 GHVU01066350.1:512-889(+)